MSAGEGLFKNSVRLSSLLLILIFVGILITLLAYSIPAIRAFGAGFITSSEWNPVTKQFGAWPPIVGTLVSSLVALVIAVPVSFGIAVFVNEVAPRSIRGVVARAVELMAGIPSIIYGMWGLFVLAPYMALHIQPAMIDIFADIPVLNKLFGGAPTGVGMLSAGLILALMVIPLISSVMRDVISTVPPQLKEAAYAVSATRWEVVRYILLPHSGIGLMGAIILGFGRALGETMAVTFVIGNAHQLSESLFMPSTPISATIANEFSEATGTLYRSALMELGLILFLMTFIMLAASRFLITLTKSRQS